MAPGLAKADSPFSEWLKEVAPSAELRRWYGHRPDRFDEFSRCYREELTREPARSALEGLRSAARSADVVLVTATRDVEHSAAAVPERGARKRLSAARRVGAGSRGIGWRRAAPAPHFIQVSGRQ